MCYFSIFTLLIPEAQTLDTLWLTVTLVNHIISTVVYLFMILLMGAHIGGYIVGDNFTHCRGSG